MRELSDVQEDGVFGSRAVTGVVQRAFLGNCQSGGSDLCPTTLSLSLHTTSRILQVQDKLLLADRLSKVGHLRG